MFYVTLHYVAEEPVKVQNICSTCFQNFKTNRIRNYHIAVASLFYATMITKSSTTQWVVRWNVYWLGKWFWHWYSLRIYANPAHEENDCKSHINLACCSYAFVEHDAIKWQLNIEYYLGVNHRKLMPYAYKYNSVKMNGGIYLLTSIIIYNKRVYFVDFNDSRW